MHTLFRSTILLACLLALASTVDAQERRRRVVGGNGQETMRPERPEPARVNLPDAGVTVDMERQLHLPVIRALVNGHGPYRFGIDTGASGQLSVSDEIVKALALESVGEVTASDGTGRNTAQRTMYGVDSLSIGDTTFHDLRTMSGNYNRGPLAAEPIDGIIGIGLFNGLSLTLDYPSEQVRISRDALPEPDDAEILAIDTEEPVPTIEWTIGGQAVRTHIDARNMGAIMLPKSIADELPLDGEPVQVGEARTQFNTIPIEAATLTTDVSLGRHVLAAPTVTFADIFRTANIGSRVMEHFIVTIDMLNNRIRFHREGDEPISLPRPRPPAERGTNDC